MVAGWKLATVIVGVAITLPAFLIGAEIMTSLGTQKGMAAIFTAGILLAVIAGGCMYIAVVKRETTYQMIDAPFAMMGSRFVSFLVSLTLLGWFGVTVSLFGDAMEKSVLELLAVSLPLWVYIGFGTIIMIFTSIYGFQAIGHLSKIAVPLMLFVLIMGLYTVLSKYCFSGIWSKKAAGENNLSFGEAVSMIIGSFMVGVTIIPDLAR